MFERILAHSPGKIALQDNARIVRYGDLQHEINVKREQLNDVRSLAIMLDNSIDWILWDLAAMQSGIPCIPLPPFFSPEQVEHSLRTAGVSHILSSSGLQKTGLSAVSLFDGTAKITFTSGTTGTPKGVCLPVKAMEAVASSIVDILGQDFAGRHVSVLPLAVLLENVAGVYSALMAGGHVILTGLAQFGPDYAGLHDRLKEVRATSAILVPELLHVLMAQVAKKGALPDLKFVAVGGAKMDASLVMTARAMGLPAYEGYGLSECASVVSLNTPAHDRPGTVGSLLSHVKARILENGEVQIKSPGFLGYLGDAAPDVFSTGDIGTFDGDYLAITGRRKNILITSYGRNVSPEWIEAALSVQPEIYQVIVYGDSMPHLGALIVPTHKDADIAAAISRTNIGLPDYAQVKVHHIVPPFTQEAGFLTGNGRPRRDMIHSHYSNLIEKENYHDVLRYSGKGNTSGASGAL